MSDPQTLLHYRIVAPLGQGGMGEVFLAEDTRLHRRVALKVLSRTMAADPERRERFAREARAIAALNHPNIVTIHTVEDAEGVPFLTMELVEGQQLGELIPTGGMPVPTLLDVAIQVSEAMAAAHERGIVHRDLKPANIMVTAGGRVKVLDFGLAKLREAGARPDVPDAATRLASDLTGEQRIIGTVAYMSPEQAEGKAVDNRSDIFSLGVILYELASGERPFKGDTNLSLLSAILKDTPRTVTELNPALPSGLARIIQRALAKDPSRRYQTALDLRNDLEDLQQEFETGSRTLAARATPPKHRRRVLVMAAAAVAVVAAAGVLVPKYWTVAGPSERLAIERMAPLTTDGDIETSVALSPDGRHVAFARQEKGRTSSLWIRQIATRSEVQILAPAPISYYGLTYSPDANYLYYYYYYTNPIEDAASPTGLTRVPALGGMPQQVLSEPTSGLTFSPDGRRFATQSNEAIVVADADGSNLRPLAAVRFGDYSLRAPAWSPDGSTLLAVATRQGAMRHEKIVAIDSSTGRITPVEGAWTSVNQLLWRPDSRSFLLVGLAQHGEPSQVWEAAYPSGERRRLTHDLTNYIFASASRDGRTMVVGKREISLSLWVASIESITRGEQITMGRGTEDGRSGLTWTPDGRILFSSTRSGQRQIWMVDADGQNARQLTADGGGPSILPSVTHDGRYIVFDRNGPTGRRIWRMALDGSGQTQLSSGARAEWLPYAAADGFAYFHRNHEAGGTRVFKIPVAGGAEVPIGEFGFYASGVSSDGRQLLGWLSRAPAVPAGGTLAILPIDGSPPTLLRDVPDAPVAWAPDGSIIVWAQEGAATRISRYDVPAGRLRPLGVIADQVRALAVAPDGRRVVMSLGRELVDLVLLQLTSGSQP